MQALAERNVIWLVVLVAVCALGGHASPAWAQAPPPQFQTEVDLIPVDVHVLDRAGQPMRGLRQDQFEVTINGRRRRIASVTFVDLEGPAPVVPSATSSSAGPVAAAFPSGQRRLFVLAVDVSSFDESTGRPVLRRAADFIRRLRPNDEVGLFAYPIGPKIDFTIDHEAVIRALDTIMARRETPGLNLLNLSISDIIDVSSGGQAAEAVSDRVCGRPPELLCPEAVIGEAGSAVLVYEALAQTSITPLLRLMNELGRIPERKTLVLVSGGLPSGEAGGRPNHTQLGTAMGRVAAEHNVNIYTLFLDQLWTSLVSAETAKPSFGANIRDSSILGRWLGELSGAAGGTLMRVAAGDGANAFDRILTETSGYYLLGVEPSAEDRDGRAHELRVKVDARDVNVRGRSWVVVPKPGAARSVAATSSPTGELAPTLPPTPAAVQALADAFDRNDRQPMIAALAPRGADALIAAFRDSESPWPKSPRRTAAFALDLALIGARSDSPFVQESATRLLVEYAIRVRQPEPDDPFECAWLWTAVAGIEGLMASAAGTVLADRAAARCPSDPSLMLARAVVRDQQLIERAVSIATRRDIAPPPSDLETFVLDLYNRAAVAPAARFEARVRAAALHARAGRYDAGLTEIAKRGLAADDLDLAFLADLVEGQLLLGARKQAEAVLAFRRALEKRPDAQSARVSLLSALVTSGQPNEAAALAEAVATADGARLDPWALFPFGDYRAFGFVRGRLLELAR
jgi:VWFA-related protein